MNEGRGDFEPPRAERAASAAIPDGEVATGETCDHCGSRQLSWRKCKLICDTCRQITKSCADL